MSRYNGHVICLLIMIMDIIAGILGIEADLAQNKVKDLRVWIIECRDPSYEAFKLGLAAAVLLAINHTVSNLLSGFIFIWSKEEMDKASPNKKLAVASLISSWILVVIAFSILIAGALENSRSRKDCGISHHRLLSLGGVLCFFHALFSVVYYVSASAYVEENEKLNQPGAQTV